MVEHDFLSKALQYFDKKTGRQLESSAVLMSEDTLTAGTQERCMIAC